MQDIPAQAQKFKEDGNANLKANDADKAVENYTQAIKLAETEGSRITKQKTAIYYANRAYAHIKLENYGLAVADAEASIIKNPQYQKGYLRLAFAKEVLLCYKEAYTAYLKAFQISGKKDEMIYQKLADCKKQNEQYLKNKKLAMFHDQSRKEAPKEEEKAYKNWRQIEVQPSYSGPRLDEKQEVTSQWVLKLMEHFKDQKNLHKRYTLQMIQKCKDILASYQSLVDYQVADDEQITVCGDIHGQYYDLYNIFKLNGNPAINNKYLFNGDFVDRGSFSVECILTLVAWKCANKDFLHMTRGNHEAKQVNHIYGFKGEVQAKYKDVGVYQAFSQLFCYLPLAYVFNQRVMVCHGGLPSYDGVTLDDIRKVYRYIQPPEKGLMCDLLWADPSDKPGHSISKRGASMCFGSDVTKRFLAQNKISLLIRSHQVKQQGYEQTHDKQCITIFSAPNYCDFSGNKAAFIRLKGDSMIPKFTQFNAVPHPPVGPMAYAGNFRGMF